MSHFSLQFTVVNVEPWCCFILVGADHEALTVKYLNLYGCVISAYFLMCRDVSRESRKTNLGRSTVQANILTTGHASTSV
jgi:hypothetical protein